MKRIAFVFSTVPHDTVASREGLDVSLVTFALTDDLVVFFIADDVSQLLSGQKPSAASVYDYIATFKLLGLCSIGQYWVYAASLRECGLDPQAPFAVETTPLETDVLHCELINYDVILRF